MCVVSSVVRRNWCLVGMSGHVRHFLFQQLFAQGGFSVGLFVGVANSCMYLVLASLFLSDGFLL